MGTLPQLTEADIHRFDQVLGELLRKTDASIATLIDRGGFLITSRGDAEGFDLTTISALASGAYLANQTIAGLVHESAFNSVYQQGEKHSLYIVEVDEYVLLAIIFATQVGVGVVKYYAAAAVRQLSEQLRLAAERAPGEGLDLSMLNVADTGSIFRKKS